MCVQLAQFTTLDLHRITSHARDEMEALHHAAVLFFSFLSLPKTAIRLCVLKYRLSLFIYREMSIEK